ncbi:Coiled stalk of trimeric autotransporter adhesin [Bartonella sp. WD12.1]|nr:Coiled stalk of trimeric autotransporter adhesin [Bartonella sp. WD12.1]
MATLLSSVSPVFASHLSSTGSTVQSVSAGEVSAKGDKAGSGRVGVANGNRSCGVDQVVSRSSSRLGKKVSVKEQYKKLSKNQLSDGSGDYSFESSCGADASVNVLTSASARSLIDVDAAASDWLLEENNTINWSVNTRSGNTTGARVAGTQMRGVIDGLLCRPGQEQSLCIGELTETEGNETGIALGYKARAIRGPRAVGYDPITNGTSEKMNSTWMSTLGELGIGDGERGQSRQITGVAAGVDDNEAVNVAQLKALRQWVQDEGVTWQLSINGQKPIKVDSENGVNLVSEGDNLTITQIDSSNKVAFNLAENLKVSSVTVKGDGPKLDVSGIDAGNKSITNVAKGTIAQASTEAINGSQLYETNTTIAKYLGGEAAYEDGDKWTKPTYKIQDTPYNDVGSAFKGVDNKLSELFKQVQGMESAGLVQKDELNVITIGKDAEGDEISVANSSRDKRKITGLKDGALSDESTDAVTGKQLHKVDKSVKELSSTVEKFESSVSSLAGNLNESLGGGSNVLKGKQPEYNIQGKDRTGIEAAFEGVDEKLTELDGKIQGVTGEVSNALVAQEKGTNVITIGAKAEGNKISIFNKSKKTRTLTGLKDGDLSEKSTDAVNGAQLYKLGSDISRYLGGGADVLKGEQPKYEIQKKPYNDVGSAFEGVDASLSSLSKQVEAVEGRFIVHQDEGTHKITIGAKTEGDEISISGSKGPRKLTGLKEGKVDVGSTDAVTGAQLHGVKQSVEGFSSTVESMQENVTKFNTNLNKYLGGNADVLNDTPPTYKIQDQERVGVAAAFEGVDSKLTELSSKVGNAEKNNLVTQEVSKVITIGGKVEGDEISIASSAGLRKLTNLEDGKLSDESTDAVTGKQLHGVKQNVEGLSSTVKKAEKDVSTLVESLNKSLGGGADVLKGKQPEYEIQEKPYTGVEAAFNGVDGKLTELSKQVEGVTHAISNSLVVQDKSSNVITIGKEVGGNEISIANSSGGKRKITNLEEGDLSDKSTEAVTGAQLHKVDKSVQELSGTVKKAESDVSSLADNLNKSLGGGSNVLSGKQPEYKIQTKPYNGVEAAFSGVDKVLTELDGKIQGITGVVSNALVAQEEDTNVITIGAKAEGNKISIFNKSKKTRTLTGLKDGDLSEKSTDAVNGAQLYKLGSDISRYLGGGADVLKGEQPKYEIQKKPYNDVGSAFEGVDASLSSLSKQVEAVEGRFIVHQDEGTHKITIGAKTEGDEISISGSKGPRKLTGLKEGKVDVGSTDAVTGAQLHGVKQSVEGFSSTVESMQENVTKFNTNLNKYLGGNADVLNDTPPTYKIQDQERVGVAAAFEGVDSKLTELSSKVGNAEKNNLVTQEVSKVITIGGKVEGDEISIASSAGLRKLTNLEDGKLSDESTDAVTGKQLHKVDKSVKELSSTVKKAEGDVSTLVESLNKSLGGGADVLKGKEPKYEIQKKPYTGVEAAFNGVDGKLTELSEQVEGVTHAISNSLVQKDELNVITIGKKVGGDEISIANSSGGKRKITGLKDGALSDESTDAVTGKQLHDVKQNAEKLSSTVEKAESDVSSLADNLNKSLGGGSNILSGQKPKYEIQKNSYTGVEDAFSGVDKVLTELDGKIQGITGVVSNALVAQEEGTNVITIGAKAEGDKISIFNKSKKTRTLTGLKNGDLSGESTDAVNGAQLYKVDENVKELNITIESVQENVTKFNTNVNEYLGGNADVLNSTPPTYKIQGEDRIGVAAAFEGVDISLTDLYEKFDGLQNSVGDDSLVAQNEVSKLITIGANVEGNKISITNREGKARKLTGLAKGKLNESSTDAVTGAQLHEVKEKIEPLNVTVESAQADVKKLNANINKYLGGGADVLKGQQPTYEIQGTPYHSVGIAFEGVDGKLTDLYEKLDKVESVGDDSLVAQHSETKVITIGGKVQGSKISITNSKGEARTLTGLKDGEVTASSTDAVTGAQLFEIKEKIEPLSVTVEKAKGDISTLDTNINKYLGGGADVLKGKQPTYKIQDTAYHSVGTAFVGVNNTLTDLSNQLEDIENNLGAGGNSLVAQDPLSHIITIGAQARGDEISITNNNGKSRILSGVKDGKITANSTEAITGNQLYVLNKQLAAYFGGGAGYEDGKWTDPTFTITDFGAQSKNEKQAYHNVAEAFGAVNSSMSGLNDRIEKVEQQTSSQMSSDRLIWNNDKNAYDANHNGQAGKITDVADGAIKQGSSDAVTGNQLWETNEKIDNLENKVDGIISDISTITDGVVTYDKDEQGNKINSITLVGGKEDEPVLIDNVADGKIGKGSKQAVNGGQLHDYVKEKAQFVLANANKYTDEKIENIVGDAVAQANAYTDMKFNALSYKVDSIEKEARQAAAIGLAVANLRYDDTPGKFSVTFGNGTWRGHSAPAFGAGYTSEDGDIRSNLSVTTSGGHWGVGAGISFTLN